MKEVKPFYFEGTSDGYIVHAGPHFLGQIRKEGIIFFSIPQEDFFYHL